MGGWLPVVVAAVGLSLAACSGSGSPARPSLLDPLTTTAAAVSTSSTSSTTTSSTTSTTTTTTPPTTTIPLVTEGASVIVANAAGVPGAAAATSNALGALGFVMGEATNAAAWDETLDITKIYARSEAAAVAESLARVLGGVAVERMPTPAPIVGANEALGDAGVLVMLGKDLAGQPLPGA
ncbi:MAG: hypothetical protein RLZZ362_2092 [Actinomycetota bacterium]